MFQTNFGYRMESASGFTRLNIIEQSEPNFLRQKKKSVQDTFKIPFKLWLQNNNLGTSYFPNKIHKIIKSEINN